MANYKTAKIIPVALILIITAVSIAALFSIGRVIFFGDSNVTTNNPANLVKQELLSTNASRSVKMTVRGAIVADETFRSYQIIVSPNSRVMDVYKGYLDTPIQNVNLTNSIPAYEQLVYALQKANMMKGTAWTGDRNDLRGICSTGIVYIFEILNDGKSEKQLWTSSCSSSKGSLDAKLDQLTKLFIGQIPEAKSIIEKLW